MNKRNVLIPTLLATALATPFVFAQSAHVHADVVHQATATAKTGDTQVGAATRDAARVNAKAGVNANAQATDSVSGNVNAAANSAVTADAGSTDPAPAQEEEEETKTP